MLYNPPKPDVKRQKLIECILTWNSKHYLGNTCPKQQVNNFSVEEVDQLFSNYKTKLFRPYGEISWKIDYQDVFDAGFCSFRMSNQDALSEDLEADPFLNSALQRFICELYYQCGSFLELLSVGLITSRHYLSEHGIENGGTNGNNKSDERTVGNPE